ncbi:hypothetical protein [Brevundimonas sp.]|uniref:hypothetical protein n=1 Tax=Brevundimonas sp. TaxID=1871086 RepID=UPI0028996FE5|nr:hypothetical protein [Brevundimonas sp.]
MVEALLSATVGAGLDEQQFWDSTPYQTGLRLKAVGKARREAFLLTGWMAERFAREESLSGPAFYLRQFFDPQGSEADAEAMADAEFSRIARVFGAEIVELDGNEGVA